MNKLTLSEQALYYGIVKMPKHWEIDGTELAHHILHSNLINEKLQFSKTYDKLNTYVIEHLYVKYKLQLINRDTWGNIYVPNEKTDLLSNVNLLDLQHSPDYTCLYGINTVNCNVKIFYDDNRRKNKWWNIELKPNMFIMFPSINNYCITNDQKNSLNFVQTITYDFT
mgnify:CR=1 FL=1|tara:strand:+ start:17 stop:520 length:504 start_codon:yes stop_codon:yes gene_type:complete